MGKVLDIEYTSCKIDGPEKQTTAAPDSISQPGLHSRAAASGKDPGPGALAPLLKLLSGTCRSIPCRREHKHYKTMGKTDHFGLPCPLYVV